MKKIIGLVVTVLVLSLAGCGSTKMPQGNYQREDANLPRWAGEGISFFSADADVYGAPKLSESGFYACGMSENLDNPRLTASAARLSANRALAGYIKTEMNSAEKRISSSTNTTYQQVDESFVSVAMQGARIIDNFTDKAGNIYSLAFISESDLKKNFSSDVNQSNLIADVIKQAESK